MEPSCDFTCPCGTLYVWICTECTLFIDVLCFVLFPLCIVFPCLYQCKIYCRRVNTQLQ
jgi:hypothetical protein